MKHTRSTVRHGSIMAVAAFWLLNVHPVPSLAQDVFALVAKGGDVHLNTAYKLSHTLVVPSGTHLTCTSDVHLFDDPAMKMDAVVQIKGSGIAIEGCDIYANKAPVVIVLGSQSSGITLSRNSLHSFNHAHGILIDSPGIHDVTISDNTFVDVGYGILQNVRGPDVHAVKISGNSFDKVAADAIELNDPVTSKCCGVMLTDVRASDFAITHNKFRIAKHTGSDAGSGFCVGIAGAHDIEVSDNDCVAWNAGIHVEDRAYDIKITRNTVTTDDNEGKGEQSAIWINDGQHITVADNKIKDSAADGIHLDFDASHQVSDIDIYNNVITGCGRNGIYITGGSLGPMNSKVHDNTVSGCKSAVYLGGKLKALAIHSNQLDASSGCVFHVNKQTNKDDVDMKKNRDTNSSGDANSSCSDDKT